MDYQLPLDHPLFFQHVYATITKSKNVITNPLSALGIEPSFLEKATWLDYTEIQDGASIRNVYQARKLAQLLINDQGDLDEVKLQEAIKAYQNYLYILAPEHHLDALRHKHILKILETLYSNKQIVRFLKSISRPYAQQISDKLILATLMLPATTTVTEAHTRRAVLSAWLTYLRQNVGSCFATAPAIMVQAEQPLQFLTDMNDLLQTGRLKRVFGGIEHTVPLSRSTGIGDLKKPFYFDRTANHLWYAPGLISAFEAIQLIDPKLPFKKKGLTLKSLVDPILDKLSKGHSSFLTTVEDIIHAALICHLKLTQKDLEDYDNRPREIAPTGWLTFQATSKMTAPKNKEQLCKLFYEKFKLAKNAFTSLTDNALLKAWEFSLASFAETKSDFTKWNLYSSLGLSSNEPNGIGNNLYQNIQNKLDQYNNEVRYLDSKYEPLYAQSKMLETRMQRASEREITWLRAEYQNLRVELNALAKERDKAYHKASVYTHLFPFLLNIYYEKFQRYFQEVYDADMHDDVKAHPYDDSPAGFRLVYKYGRDNSAMWTTIHSPNEYIEALDKFFTATEHEIAALPELEGLSQEFNELITDVVKFIKNPEFLEGALHRMAKAHNLPLVKDPLKHLDKIPKKPWAYTSGGSMSNLISSYYRLESPPTEQAKWFESPTEFLVFLLDTMKGLPHNITKPYLEDENRSMLMFSPTHAFIFKPGQRCFRKGWQEDKINTYTWVRDQIIIPRQKFLNEQHLSSDMQQRLLIMLSKHLPQSYRRLYLQAATKSMFTPGSNPILFRKQFLGAMEQHMQGFDYLREHITDEIDSLLYSQLPMLPQYKLKDAIATIVDLLPETSPQLKKKMLDYYQRLEPTVFRHPIITSQQLLSIVKALIVTSLEQTATPVDYHKQVYYAAQEAKLASPSPVIFADTNWIKDYFAFIINPGTNELELWRMDELGIEAKPMSMWRHHLNGMDRTEWGIYTQPHQYGQG
ncbi:MAG: hypothetical protein K0S74_1390 [Chlamydiales bacterium]|jgi:hypothetical protein|nr:hypothetical protein [Chlamydiales bacterium]